MDRKAVARQIREAIFDQAEIDGRVMHGDKMDEIIEKVLALHDSPAPARPSWFSTDTVITLINPYDFYLTKEDGA